jgi:hypothetical protein
MELIHCGSYLQSTLLDQARIVFYLHLGYSLCIGLYPSFIG